jgi:GNAT superfamily N-acetyltransferase
VNNFSIVLIDIGINIARVCCEEEKVLLKIEKVDKRNFKDISSPCKYCLYWQTSVPFDEEMLKPEMEREKREWFSKVIRDFGNCGFIAYFRGVPMGFIQYASIGFFPRIEEYASGPPSEDAVFLACLYIADKEARGKGLGTAMLKELLAELRKRKFEAVETFAGKKSENNPSGPLELYLKCGFKIRNDKDDFPLVRFEL